MKTNGFLILGVLLLVSPTHASVTQSVPDCVSINAEARYQGYGYTHFVRIRNSCEQKVSCLVSTDVNPTIQKAELEPQSTTEVITFRGSPSREFNPVVRCEKK